MTAKLPIILGQPLHSAGYDFPMTSLTVAVNEVGTVSVTGHPTVQSIHLAPMFVALTKALNDFTGTLPSEYGPNDYQLFTQAPTDVDVAIHGVTLFALGDEEKELTQTLTDALLCAKNLTVISARFLRKNLEDRKNTTTVIVVLAPTDAAYMGQSVHLFSMNRKCNIMWSATPSTQCRRCYKHGHATQGCVSKEFVCPICARDHPKHAHNCPHPNCIGEASHGTPCCSGSLS